MKRLTDRHPSEQDALRAQPRPAGYRAANVWAKLINLGYALFGHLRVGRGATRILGFQYTRALRKIEIDITYSCNLSCPNCDRSCGQAPTGERMTADQIARFVAESVEREVKWEQIRLLGGEPTLHPQFLEILALLVNYKRSFSPQSRIEVATNGYGKKVKDVLGRISAEVQIINTNKHPDIAPVFDTFNVAPLDLKKYSRADYRNGCSIIDVCGIGLAPSGFYPCAAAGGIDRIMGYDAGRKTLPEDEDRMRDLLEKFCRHCGHFKRNREAWVDKEVMSPSWQAAYAQHGRQKTQLTRYASPK